MNSACGQHIGALPSQQPPDWWNISGPYFVRNWSISAIAASVAVTRKTFSVIGASDVWPAEKNPAPGAGGRGGGCGVWGEGKRPGRGGRVSGVTMDRNRSEEPELVLAVAHHQVLRLLVVVEHHLVVLAPDARVLVAAECSVGRVEVVAVGPHAPGLYALAHAERGVHVAAPHA